MNILFGYRYRSHGHHWSIADWIAFVCALIVIYVLRRAAEKYFPGIGERTLNIISFIIIVIAVFIAAAFE